MLGVLAGAARFSVWCYQVSGPAGREAGPGLLPLLRQGCLAVEMAHGEEWPLTAMEGGALFESMEESAKFNHIKCYDKSHGPNRKIPASANRYRNILKLKVAVLILDADIDNEYVASTQHLTSDANIEICRAYPPLSKPG